VLTQEEVDALAQKQLAADDYLEEAKGKLREADTLIRDLKSKATQPGQPATHPGGEDGSQPQTGAPQHPEDAYASVIEKIQFGEPKDAAALLQQVVNDAVTAKSLDTVRQDRIRSEWNRSNLMLKDFKDKNKDLAEDPYLSAAIERRLYELQLDDLRGLGLEEEKLPQNPAQIADLHRTMRAEGLGVRDITTLLDKASGDMVKRFSPEPKPDPTPAQQKASPKVAVSVDRTARRAVIPQQPSRTVAPKPDASAPAQDETERRSAIVQRMMVDRGKPRGKVYA
jgi:hypothetical protein